MRLFVTVSAVAALCACTVPAPTPANPGSGSSTSASAPRPTSTPVTQPAQTASAQPSCRQRMLGSFNLCAPWRAFGTEPYWDVAQTHGQLAYTDYSTDPVARDVLGWVTPTVTGSRAVYAGTTTAGRAWTLTLTQETCLEVGEESDPMRARFEIGGVVRNGCAGPPPPPEPSSGAPADRP